MVATPNHVPGENRDALLARIARLEKALAALGNRTRLSTVQGTLTEFDVDTGANTVTVGQDTMTDLPLLVSGAEIGLEPGDTVVIAVLGEGTPAIMGKLATVGSTNYGSSNNGRAGITLSATDFANSTAGVTLIEDTSITVPTWANSALLTMFGSASMHNNSGSLDNWSSEVAMTSGAGFAHSGSMNVAVPNGSVGSTYALFSEVVAVVPDESLLFQFAIISGAHNWPTDTNATTIAGLTAQLQFFRESV